MHATFYMLLFEVDNKEYKAFHSWGEMPLSIAISIHTLCVEQMPGKLKEIYKLLATPNEEEEQTQKELIDWYNSVTDEERIKTFPLFYGKIIELVTTLPKDVIEHIRYSSRETFYKKYCEDFIFGILCFPVNYEYKNITSFEFNDVKYFLPETKEVLGAQKPFFDRSAIEFTESADLELFSKDFAGGKYEVAANIVSILCRPKAGSVIEPYSEEVSLQRAKDFLNIKMDIIWEVFFCFQKHINLSNQIIAISLTEEAIKLNLKNQAELKSLVGTEALSKQPEGSIK